MAIRLTRCVRQRPPLLIAMLVAMMLLATGVVATAQRRPASRAVRTAVPRGGVGAALPVKVPPTCELHGTCVAWAPNLAAAKSEASRQKKLLFVMHLSGNFTNPTFT